MLRKLFVIGVVGLVVAVLLAGDLAMVAPTQVSAAPAAQGTDAAGKYMWNYSVKFVCGHQRGATDFAGEPVVKPGNYATEINIHNYQYREVKVFKKLLILVNNDSPQQGAIGREPKQVEPVAFDFIPLKPDAATMDDCNRLWSLAKVPLIANQPLTVGYLVILSPVDLDIDAVYTAQTSVTLGAGAQAQPIGSAIDVERVHGKRVFVPAGYMQNFPTQPVP